MSETSSIWSKMDPLRLQKEAILEPGKKLFEKYYAPAVKAAFDPAAGPEMYADPKKLEPPLQEPSVIVDPFNALNPIGASAWTKEAIDLAGKKAAGTATQPLLHSIWDLIKLPQERPASDWETLLSSVGIGQGIRRAVEKVKQLPDSTQPVPANPKSHQNQE